MQCYGACFVPLHFDKQGSSYRKKNYKENDLKGIGIHSELAGVSS